MYTCREGVDRFLVKSSNTPSCRDYTTTIIEAVLENCSDVKSDTTAATRHSAFAKT
jgi:hypothetical protein